MPLEDPFKVKQATDYFKMFYADTALYGDTPSLMMGFDFFGPEKMVFGTDFPYDIDNGDLFIRKTIEAVYKMNISEGDKKRIFEDNPRNLLSLS